MQKAFISVYAECTNALWQRKWKRILIPCQAQLPGTLLCCLLRPSVPLWHSSKMLAGCLLNTEETVLEVAPLKVCQTSVCVWTEPAVPVATILFESGLLVFGSVRGCFFHVPCSLMECQDSQTCSLCPGLFRPQPKSICLFHWIGSNCGLSIISCWPLKCAFFPHKRWTSKNSSQKKLYIQDSFRVIRPYTVKLHYSIRSTILIQTFTFSNVIFFNKLFYWHHLATDRPSHINLEQNKIEKMMTFNTNFRLLMFWWTTPLSMPISENSQSQSFKAVTHQAGCASTHYKDYSRPPTSTCVLRLRVRK